MDFYALKFLATSNLTGETYVGYMFGKKAQTPYFNVLLLTRAQLREIDLPDITKDYLDFKSDIDMLYYKLSKEKNNNLISQFKAYFYSMLKKMKSEVTGTKIFMAIEDEDVYVLKSILSDILSEWAGDTKIKLVAQKFDYKDLTWITAVKEKGEEGLKEYLNREDVKDATEIYPIIDPIEGYSVSKLDIGEPIIVLPMENKNENEKNVGKVVEGKIISKELIPSSDYIFLKVDLGNGALGKAVVHRELKVSVDQNRLQILRKSQEKTENENETKIIGDLYNQMKKEKSMPTDKKIGSLDILIISGFSIIGILLIILIVILLGSF